MKRSRRDLMKVLGASSVLGMSGTDLVSAKSKTPQTALVYGTPSDPITPAAIERIQREEIRKHRNKTGDSQNIPVAKIGYTSEETIVAFSYKLNNEGQIGYYIGSASSPQNVKKVQTKAKNKIPDLI